jgi:hypothetical protein
MESVYVFYFKVITRQELSINLSNESQRIWNLMLYEVMVPLKTINYPISVLKSLIFASLIKSLVVIALNSREGMLISVKKINIVFRFYQCSELRVLVVLHDMHISFIHM